MGAENNKPWWSPMTRFFVMLGHGRALETYLIAVKLLMAAVILASGNELQIVALRDLSMLPDYWLAAPFFGLAIIQYVGLCLNIRGIEASHDWRIAGSVVAICLWAWLITKSILIGAILTGSMPFWIMSFAASWFLLLRGITRQPPVAVLEVPR